MLQKVAEYRHNHQIVLQIETPPNLPWVVVDEFYIVKSLQLLLERFFEAQYTGFVTTTPNAVCLTLDLSKPAKPEIIERDLQFGWRSNLRFGQYIIEQHQGSLTWRYTATGLIQGIVITLPTWHESAAHETDLAHHE
jgi:hypothetical protein